MSADTPGLILHMDDERAVRESFAFLLCANGYTVHSAASGKQALELAGEDPHPDVLIVDFHIDEQMNSAQVAEQIGAVLHYTPPTTMLSGDLGNAASPRITDAPVWMSRKPMDPRRLLVALPRLIQLSRATRRLDAGGAVEGLHLCAGPVP